LHLVFDSEEAYRERNAFGDLISIPQRAEPALRFHFKPVQKNELQRTGIGSLLIGPAL